MKHFADHRERVVFDVLVTNRVVGIQSQHRRHIALLEMPQPFGCHRVGDVPHKLSGGLEVVKHRDRCDERGFGGLTKLRHHRLPRKEIHDQAALFVVIGAELSGGRIYTDFLQTRRAITAKEGSVIATNINH